MSRVFITASSDASIYERYANLNTGRDEISRLHLERGYIDTSRVVNGRLSGEEGSNLRHGFADVVEAEPDPLALGVKLHAILEFQLPRRPLAPPDRI